MTKQVLLLVGSPKPNKSTSEALGDYVLDGMQKNGHRTQRLNINSLLKRADGSEALINYVNECDILIFSCPLYVDSTPAIVIKAMEIIAENRSDSNKRNKQAMLAICNSGFPEAYHNHTALKIFRCFAQEAGFEWAGGLALGGGGAINGQPLAKLGGMTKKIIQSLDLTIEALHQGRSVPDNAIKLIEKPMFPTWLYLLFGQIGWIIQAREFNTQKKLNDRPY